MVCAPSSNRKFYQYTKPYSLIQNNLTSLLQFYLNLKLCLKFSWKARNGSHFKLWIKTPTIHLFPLDAIFVSADWPTTFSGIHESHANFKHRYNIWQICNKNFEFQSSEENKQPNATNFWWKWMKRIKWNYIISKRWVWFFIIMLVFCEKLIFIWYLFLSYYSFLLIPNPFLHSIFSFQYLILPFSNYFHLLW